MINKSSWIRIKIRSRKNKKLKLQRIKFPYLIEVPQQRRKISLKWWVDVRLILLIKCSNFDIYSRKTFALDRTPDVSTVTPTRLHSGGGPLMPRARPSVTRVASISGCTDSRGQPPGAAAASWWREQGPRRVRSRRSANVILKGERGEWIMICLNFLTTCHEEKNGLSNEQRIRGSER